MFNPDYSFLLPGGFKDLLIFRIPQSEYACRKYTDDHHIGQDCW